MSQRWIAVLGTLGLVALAAPAFADEASDLRKELDALKQRLDAQDQKVRQMEGTTITQQEVDAAVLAYVGNAPAPILVADDDKGSAGFPLGKKPFIKVSCAALPDSLISAATSSNSVCAARWRRTSTTSTCTSRRA